MLKRYWFRFNPDRIYQPPSGGCVLKLLLKNEKDFFYIPAAFRRLCVETYSQSQQSPNHLPAAFRRLCVETYHTFDDNRRPFQPPSGGCVLKQQIPQITSRTIGPAAFRRLCVETITFHEDTLVKIPAAFRRLCVETGFGIT